MLVVVEPMIMLLVDWVVVVAEKDITQLQYLEQLILAVEAAEVETGSLIALAWEVLVL